MDDYQRQDSALTLREGLDAYFRAHPGLLRGDELSSEAQDFFRSHDAAHVVFGCGTSLPHEAVVKLSSIFGSTGGLTVLRGYRLHESVTIYRALGLGEIVLTLVAAIVVVPRTLWRCTLQRRRWPWCDFDAWLDQPLTQIRTEFGIRV